VLNGHTLCEDCYLEESHPVRTCDPWPAYSAKRLKTSGSLEAEESLTALQTAIFNFIKSEGKVAKQELTDKFGLSQMKIENQLAILRHLELTKAKKEGEKIFIVLFSSV
jgi:predicted HTH transcriptional regulator